MIYVDGKYLIQRTTGVQRYAREIIGRWSSAGLNFSVLDPRNSPIGRRRVEVWEQLLGRAARDGMLWCPTNTGPVNFQRKVLTLHDGAVLAHPEWFAKRYSLWRRWAIPRLLKSSFMVLTVSEFSKHIICDRTGYPQDRIRVIGNGVDLQSYGPWKADSAVPFRYGIKKPYFLSVGSIDPRKNIGAAIAAWQRLPAACRDEFDLVIVGGESAAFGASEVQAASCAHMLGYVPDADLPMLYAGATAFLYPSKFEGFGLPVLEAMASGTPVLAGNCSALPEVTGGAALLVDPYSIEDIAAGIYDLMINEPLRQRLVELGQRWVKRFSWDETAAATWQALHEAQMT